MHCVPVDRRSFVIGAAIAPACAAQRGGARAASTAGDVPYYELDVALADEASALIVRGTVTLPASLSRRDTLTIALADTAADVRIWTSEDGEAGADLPLVRNEDGVGDLRRWRVALPAGREPPERLSFSLRLEQRSGLLFALARDAVFVSAAAFAWYPQVVDENDIRLLGVGVLSYRLGDLTVVSSGQRLGSTADDRVYFRAQTPNYFAFAAGRYLAPAGRPEHSRVWLLQSRPSTAQFGARIELVLRALEREFGPLPDRRLDLVEAPTEAARAAGFDGASLDGFMLLIGDYFEQPFNTAFFAHEAAHQWWGGSVRRRGLPGAYLMDESLAQYGSLRAVEALEGEDAARSYRRTGYPGYYTEYSAFWYLARSLAGIDAPLAEFHAADDFTARRVANSKAMFVWDMLSRVLGRRRFAAFLSSFASEHAYQRVSLDVFMQSLRSVAGADAWFIDQWFTRVGAPSFSFAWRHDGRNVTLNLAQAPPYYRARLPVRICGVAGQSAQVHVEIMYAEAQAQVAFPHAVAAVELDPDYTVLRWTEPMRARAVALLPYTRGDILLNQGNAAAAEGAFREALEQALPEGGELRFQLLRGLGDATSSTRPQEAVAFYRQSLSAAPALHEALPEVWRSLGDAFRAQGDMAGHAEAAAGQRAAILALHTRRAR